MSYVHKGPRLFQDRGDIKPERRRSESRLKTYPSSLDLRNWCYVVEDRRKHIIELIAKDIEKCTGRVVPIKSIIDALMASKNADIAHLKNSLQQLWEFINDLQLSDKDLMRMDRMKRAMRGIYLDDAPLLELNSDECIAKRRHDRERTEIEALIKTSSGEESLGRVRTKFNGPAKLVTRIKGVDTGFSIGPVVDLSKPGQITVKAHAPTKLGTKIKKVQPLKKEKPRELSKASEVLVNRDPLPKREAASSPIRERKLGEVKDEVINGAIRDRLTAAEMLCERQNAAIDKLEKERDTLERKLKECLKELGTFKKLEPMSLLSESYQDENKMSTLLDLQDKLHDLERVTQERDDLKNKVCLLEQKLMQYQNLPDELGTIRSSTEMLDSVMKERDKLSQKIKQLKDMEKEVLKLRKKADRVDELERELRSHSKLEKSSGTELKKSQSMYENLERELKNTKSERDAMAKRIENLKKEVDSNKSKIREAEMLRLERDGLQIKLNELNEIQAQFEVVMEKLKTFDTIKDERDMYKQKYEEILEMECRCEMLQSQVDEAHFMIRERDHLKKQVHDLETCICEQENEIKRLISQMDSNNIVTSFKEELTSKTQILSNLEKKLDLQRVRIEELEILLHKAEHALSQKDCHIKCLENQLNDREYCINRSKKLNQKEFESVELMRRELDAAKAENKKLQDIANKMISLTGDGHVKKMLKQSECAIKRVVQELGKQYREWDSKNKKNGDAEDCTCPTEELSGSDDCEKLRKDLEELQNEKQNLEHTLKHLKKDGLPPERHRNFVQDGPQIVGQQKKETSVKKYKYSRKDIELDMERVKPYHKKKIRKKPRTTKRTKPYPEEEDTTPKKMKVRPDLGKKQIEPKEEYKLRRVEVGKELSARRAQIDREKRSPKLDDSKFREERLEMPRKIIKETPEKYKPKKERRPRYEKYPVDQPVTKIPKAEIPEEGLESDQVIPTRGEIEIDKVPVVPKAEEKIQTDEDEKIVKDEKLPKKKILAERKEANKEIPKIEEEELRKEKERRGRGRRVVPESKKPPGILAAKEKKEYPKKETKPFLVEEKRLGVTPELDKEKPEKSMDYTIPKERRIEVDLQKKETGKRKGKKKMQEATDERLIIEEFEEVKDKDIDPQKKYEDIPTKETKEQKIVLEDRRKKKAKAPDEIDTRKDEDIRSKELKQPKIDLEDQREKEQMEKVPRKALPTEIAKIETQRKLVSPEEIYAPKDEDIPAKELKAPGIDTEDKRKKLKKIARKEIPTEIARIETQRDLVPPEDAQEDEDIESELKKPIIDEKGKRKKIKKIPRKEVPSEIVKLESQEDLVITEVRKDEDIPGTELKDIIIDHEDKLEIAEKIPKMEIPSAIAKLETQRDLVLTEDVDVREDEDIPVKEPKDLAEKRKKEKKAPKKDMPTKIAKKVQKDEDIPTKELKDIIIDSAGKPKKVKEVPRKEMPSAIAKLETESDLVLPEDIDVREDIPAEELREPKTDLVEKRKKEKKPPRKDVPSDIAKLETLRDLVVPQDIDARENEDLPAKELKEPEIHVTEKLKKEKKTPRMKMPSEIAKLETSKDLVVPEDTDAREEDISEKELRVPKIDIAEAKKLKKAPRKEIPSEIVELETSKDPVVQEDTDAREDDISAKELGVPKIDIAEKSKKVKKTPRKEIPSEIVELESPEELVLPEDTDAREEDISAKELGLPKTDIAEKPKKGKKTPRKEIPSEIVELETPRELVLLEDTDPHEEDISPKELGVPKIDIAEKPKKGKKTPRKEIPSEIVELETPREFVLPDAREKDVLAKELGVPKIDIAEKPKKGKKAPRMEIPSEIVELETPRELVLPEDTDAREEDIRVKELMAPKIDIAEKPKKIKKTTRKEIPSETAEVKTPRDLVLPEDIDAHEDEDIPAKELKEPKTDLTEKRRKEKKAPRKEIPSEIIKLETQRVLEEIHADEEIPTKEVKDQKLDLEEKPKKEKSAPRKEIPTEIALETQRDVVIPEEREVQRPKREAPDKIKEKIAKEKERRGRGRRIAVEETKKPPGVVEVESQILRKEVMKPSEIVPGIDAKEPMTTDQVPGKPKELKPKIQERAVIAKKEKYPQIEEERAGEEKLVQDRPHVPETDEEYVEHVLGEREDVEKIDTKRIPKEVKKLEVPGDEMVKSADAVEEKDDERDEDATKPSIPEDQLSKIERYAMEKAEEEPKDIRREDDTFEKISKVRKPEIVKIEEETKVIQKDMEDKEKDDSFKKEITKKIPTREQLIRDDRVIPIVKDEEEFRRLVDKLPVPLKKEIEKHIDPELITKEEEVTPIELTPIKKKTTVGEDAKLRIEDIPAEPKQIIEKRKEKKSKAAPDKQDAKLEVADDEPQVKELIAAKTVPITDKQLEPTLEKTEISETRKIDEEESDKEILQYKEVGIQDTVTDKVKYEQEKRVVEKPAMEAKWKKMPPAAVEFEKIAEQMEVAESEEVYFDDQEDLKKIEDLEVKAEKKAVKKHLRKIDVVEEVKVQVAEDKEEKRKISVRLVDKIEADESPKIVVLNQEKVSVFPVPSEKPEKVEIVDEIPKDKILQKIELAEVNEKVQETIPAVDEKALLAKLKDRFKTVEEQIEREPAVKSEEEIQIDVKEVELVVEDKLQIIEEKGVVPKSPVEFELVEKVKKEKIEIDKVELDEEKKESIILRELIPKIMAHEREQIIELGPEIQFAEEKLEEAELEIPQLFFEPQLIDLEGTDGRKIPTLLEKKFSEEHYEEVDFPELEVTEMPPKELELIPVDDKLSPKELWAAAEIEKEILEDDEYIAVESLTELDVEFEIDERFKKIDLEDVKPVPSLVIPPPCTSTCARDLVPIALEDLPTCVAICAQTSIKEFFLQPQNLREIETDDPVDVSVKTQFVALEPRIAQITDRKIQKSTETVSAKRCQATCSIVSPIAPRGKQKDEKPVPCTAICSNLSQVTVRRYPSDVNIKADDVPVSTCRAENKCLALSRIKERRGLFAEETGGIVLGAVNLASDAVPPGYFLPEEISPRKSLPEWANVPVNKLETMDIDLSLSCEENDYAIPEDVTTQNVTRISSRQALGLGLVTIPTNLGSSGNLPEVLFKIRVPSRGQCRAHCAIIKLAEQEVETDEDVSDLHTDSEVIEKFVSVFEQTTDYYSANEDTDNLTNYEPVGQVAPESEEQYLDLQEIAEKKSYHTQTDTISLEFREQHLQDDIIVSDYPAIAQRFEAASTTNDHLTTTTSTDTFYSLTQSLTLSSNDGLILYETMSDRIANKAVQTKLSGRSVVEQTDSEALLRAPPASELDGTYLNSQIERVSPQEIYLEVFETEENVTDQHGQIEVKEAYGAEQRKIASSALEQLENIKHIVEERDDLRKKLQNSQYELNELKKNFALHSVSYEDSEEKDDEESEIMVHFIKDDTKSTDVTDDEIHHLEEQIKNMRSSSLAPHEEAQAIRKEVEVLKKYCSKMSSIQEENVALKKSNKELEERLQKTDQNERDGESIEKLKEKLSALNETTAERDKLRKKVEQCERQLMAYNYLPDDVEVFKERSLLLVDVIQDRDRLAKRVEQLRGTEEELLVLRSKASRVDELERQLRLTTRELQLTEDELDNMRNKCTFAEIEVMNQKCETDTLKSKMVCMEQEVETLRSICKDQEILQLEKERLQNSLDELVRMQDDYEHMRVQIKAMDVLRTERDRYKKKYEELSGLECECDILRAQVERARGIESERDALENQIEDLEKSIAEQEEEIRRLVSHIDGLAQSKEDHKAKMRKEISALRAKLKRKETSDENLVNTQMELENSFKTVNDDLSQQNRNLQEQINDLSNNLRAVAAEKEFLSNKVNETQRIIEVMQNMMSNRPFIDKAIETNSSVETKGKQTQAELNYIEKSLKTNIDNHLKQMLEESKSAIERISVELGKQYVADQKKLYRCCPNCTCKKRNLQPEIKEKIVVKCCANCNCKRKLRTKEYTHIYQQTDNVPLTVSTCSCLRRTAQQESIRTHKKQKMTGVDEDDEELMYTARSEEPPTHFSKIDHLEQELLRANDTIMELQEKALQAEKLAVENAALKRHSAEIQDISKAQIEDLVQHLKKAKENIVELETKSCRLKFDLSACLREKDQLQEALKGKMGTSDRELAAAPDLDIIARLKVDLENCLSEKSVLLKTIEDLKMEVLKGKPDSDVFVQLQCDLENCLNEKKKLIKTIEELQLKLRHGEKYVADFVELEKIELDLKNCIEAKKQLERDLGECLNQNEKMKATIENYQKQISTRTTLDDELLKLKETLEETFRERDELLEKLDLCLSEKKSLTDSFNEMKRAVDSGKIKELPDITEFALLKANFEKCIQEKDKLLIKIEALQTTVKEANEKLNENAMITNNLENENEKLQNLVEQLQHQIDRKGEQAFIDDLEKELANCLRENQYLKNVIGELEKQIASEEKEGLLTDKLKHDLQSSFNERNALLQKNSELEEMLDNFRTELDLCSTQKQSLLQSIDELKATLQSEDIPDLTEFVLLKANLDKSLKEKSNLTIKIGKLQEELDNTKSQLEICLNDKSALMKIIDDLGHDNVKAFAELEANLAKSLAEKDLLTHEIQELEKKVKSDELGRCKIDLEKCSKENETLLKTIDELQWSIRSEKADDLPGLAEFIQQKNKLESAVAENEQLKSKMQNLSKTVNQLSAENDKLKLELQTLAVTNEQLKNENRSLKNALDQQAIEKEQFASEVKALVTELKLMKEQKQLESKLKTDEIEKLKKEKDDLDKMLSSNVMTTSRRALSLEEQLDGLSKENKELTKEMERLLGVNRTLETRNQDILSKLPNLESANDKLKTDLAKVKQENQKLAKDVERMKKFETDAGILEELKKENESQKDEIRNLLEKLKQPPITEKISKTALDQQLKENETLKAIVDDLQNQLKHITKEKAEAIGPGQVEGTFSALADKLEEMERRAELAEESLRKLKASDPSAMLKSELSKLQNEIEQLKKENNALKKMNEETEKTKSTLKRDLDNALTEIKRFEDENANLTKVNENLQKELRKFAQGVHPETLKAENESLKEKLLNLEDEINNLQVTISKAHKETRACAETMGQVQSENADLKKALVQTQVENAKIQKELTTALANAKKSREKLTATETENSKLKQKVVDLEDQATQLRRELNKILEDAKKSADTVSDLQKEIVSLKQTVAKLEAEKVKLEHREKESAKEVSKLKQAEESAAQHRNENTKLKKQIDELQKDIEDMKRKLEQEISVSKNKTTEISNLQNQISLLRKKVSELESEITYLREQLVTSDLKSEYDKLKKVLGDAENQNDKLRHDLEKATGDAKKFKQDLNESRQTEKKCKEKLAQLENDNKTLRDNINESLDNLKKIESAKLEIVTENSKLKNDYVMLEQENKKLRKNLDAAFADQNKATSQANELKEQYVLVRQRTSLLEVENATLKNELDSILNQLKASKEENTHAIEENKKAKDKINRLEKENAQVKKLLKETPKGAIPQPDDGLTSKLMLLQDSNQKLKQELDDVRNQSKEKDRELSKIIGENAQLKQKLEASNANLKINLDKASADLQKFTAERKEMEKELANKLNEIKVEKQELEAKLGELLKKYEADSAQSKAENERLKERLAKMQSENAKLKKDLDSSLADLKKIADNLSRVTDERNKFSQELSKVQADNQKLRKDLESAKRDVKKEEMGAGDLKVANEKLRQHLLQLEQDNEKLKSDLNEALDAQKNATSDLTKLREDESKTKYKLAKLETDNLRYKKNLDKAVQDAETSNSKAIQLNQENAALKQQLTKLENDISQLRKDLETRLDAEKAKARSLTNAQADNDKLRRNVRELEALNQQLKNDLDAALKAARSSSDSVDTLKKENDNQRKKIARLEAEIAKLQNDLEKANAEPARKVPDEKEHRKELARLEVDNDKLKQELSRALDETKQLANLRENVDRLKQQASRKDGEVESLKKELAISADQAKKISSELSKLKEGEAKMKQNLAQLRSENVRLKKELDASLNDNKIKNEEIVRLKSENDKLEAKVRQLEKDVEQLKKKLIDEQNKAKGASNELSELKDKNIEFRQKISQLEGDNLKLRSEAERFRGADKATEKLESENRKLRQEKSKLLADINELTKKLMAMESLAAENEQLKMEISQLRQEINGLKNELTKVQRELKDAAKSMKKLDQENGKIKNENNSMQKKLDEINNLLNDTLQQLEKFKETDIEQYLEQIKESEKKIKQLQTQISQEKKNSKEVIASLKAQFDKDIKNMMKSNEEDLNRLQKINEKYVKELEEKNMALNDALAIATREMELVRKERDRLKNLLDEQKRKSLEIKDKVGEVEQILARERRKSKEMEKKQKEQKGKADMLQDEVEKIRQRSFDILKERDSIEKQLVALRREKEDLEKIRAENKEKKILPELADSIIHKDGEIKLKKDRLTMATFETVSLAPDVIPITAPLSDTELRYFGKKPCPCSVTFEDALKKAAKKGLKSLSIEELQLIHNNISEVVATILEKYGQKTGVLKSNEGDKLSLLRRIAELEGDLMKKQKQAQQKIAEVQHAVRNEKEKITKLRKKLASDKSRNDIEELSEIPEMLTKRGKNLEDLKSELEKKLNNELINKMKLEEQLKEYKTTEVPVKEVLRKSRSHQCTARR
ncbi:uncharacterized protein LOC132697113 [Cylas formicarius]|uniref:uncharacterized protein LOC132697113 n=1 Tax=Cylas formicarius TaxID=197179 RepID=UPI0029587768|nr:uncharacterized protein LOC132697113 [Cylas formicarius]